MAQGGGLADQLLADLEKDLAGGSVADDLLASLADDLAVPAPPQEPAKPPRTLPGGRRGDRARRVASGVPEPSVTGPGEAIRSAGRGAAQTGIGVAQSAAMGKEAFDRATEVMWEKLLGYDVGGIHGGREAADKLQEVKENVLPAQGERGFLTHTAPEALGSALMFLLGGAATGGSAAGIAGLGAASGFADGFYDAQAHGASEQESWVSAAANGGISLSEAVPLGKFLARFNRGTGGSLRQALVRLLTEPASEAVQEVVQGAGSNIVAKGLYDEERELLSGLKDAGAAGFFVGALLSVASSGAAMRRAEAMAVQEGAGPEAPGGEADRTAAGPLPTTDATPVAAETATEGPASAVPGDTDATPVAALAESGQPVTVNVPEGALRGAAGSYPAEVVSVSGDDVRVRDPETGNERTVPKEWVQAADTQSEQSILGQEPALAAMPTEVGADAAAVGEIQDSSEVGAAPFAATDQGKAGPSEMPVEPGREAKPAEGSAVEATVDAAEPTPSDPPFARGETIKAEAQGWLGDRGEQATAKATERTYGIMNRKMDQAMAELGLEPGSRQEARTFEETNSKAAAILEGDPMAGQSLMAELKAKPRPPTEVENALLTREVVRLELLREQVEQDIIDAGEAGDTDLVETLQERAGKITADYADAADTLAAVGSESGRSLAFRQMLLKRDYSLAAMERKMRAAKGGAALSDEQQAEIRDLHQKIKEAQEKFEKHAAESDERVRLLEEQIDTLIKARSAGIRKERRQRPAGPVVTYISAKADEARARIKARGAQMSAGFDPLQWADHIIVGADWIARDVANLTAWSKAMLEEFGDTVKPHLEAIFEHAKKAVGTMSAEAKREEAKGKIAASKDGVRAAAQQVRKLAEAFVESGVTEREALIDAVHAVLVEVEPGVTRRDAMDLISGYGEFQPLSQDEVKVRLRQMRGEMQQLAKLEDMLSKGQLPLKTGPERRTPTDDERRLIRQVNETKKRLNLIGDPETHLRSALGTTKDRLRHQIADLQHQIDTGTQTVKGKVPTRTDAEIEALRAQRDALQAQYDAIFNAPAQEPGHAEVMQAKATERALEKAIKDYEARIAAGNVAPKTGTPRLTTPQMDALRARRDALAEELANLRAAQMPQLADQRALQAYKTRLKNDLARLREKVAAQDFTPKAKPKPIQFDSEANVLRAEMEKAKTAFERGLERERLRNRTRLQKGVDLVKEIALDLPRALRTGFDLSALLRQGAFFSMGHPVMAARQAKVMLRAMASEDYFQQVDAALRSRPLAKLGEQAKLELTQLDAPPTKREEAIKSQLSDRIPGIRASNRGFTAMLNVQRAQMFDRLVQALPTKPSAAEAKALATAVNVATGRGDPGRFAPAMGVLAVPLWSPRLLISRFQLIAGQPLYHGSARTRKLMAKEYARFLIGIGTVYSLVQFIDSLDDEDDVDIEVDPRSSDFGKIRLGKTRLDPLAGLSQVTVLLSRIASGEKKTAKGDVVPIRGELKYGQDSVWDVLAQFARYKLSPTVGAAVDIFVGENAIGEPVTAASTLESLFVPLSSSDVQEAIKEHGIAEGAALGLVSLLGWGLQVHQDRAKKPKPSPAPLSLNALYAK